MGPISRRKLIRNLRILGFEGPPHITIINPQKTCRIAYQLRYDYNVI